MKPIYKSWIKMNKIMLFNGLSILCLFGILFIPLNVVKILLLILFLIFGYIATIITLAHLKLVDYSGDYQNKIHNLLAEKIPNKKQKIIDVGTGSGSLAIKLAKKNPTIQVEGIDFFGDEWEYDLKICEKNAKIMQVEKQAKFTKASASSLPFNDHEFDSAISCLCYHEVKDASNIYVPIKETIRVLKPGGKIVMMDLFADLNHYEEMDKLINKLGEFGLENITYKYLSDEIELPKILRHKKVLKHAVIITANKRSKS